MDTDDQLAALIAGELDEDAARALRARAADDPALRRRIARFELLEAALGVPTAPPPMDPAAAGRLDTAVTAALDALADGPLDRDQQRDQDAVEPVDLAGRRTARGVPRWAGALVGAAAVVTAAFVVTSALPSGDDMRTAAPEAADAGAERMAEDEGAAGGGEGADSASDMASEPEGAASEAASQEAAEVAPDIRGEDVRGLDDDGDAVATAPDPAAAPAAGTTLAGVPVVRLPSGAPSALLDDPAVAVAVAAGDGGTQRRQQLVALPRDGSVLARCAARVLTEVDESVLALVAVDEADRDALGVAVVGPNGAVAITARVEGTACREVDRATR